MLSKLRLQAKNLTPLYWVTISVAVVACLAMAAKYTTRGVMLDWDIDTFIEISNQFTRGRLIYLDYFDPKWPHIQPLFIVAALSRSVSAQIWFSSLMIIISGILISRLPCNIDGSDRPTHASIMCGAFYIVLTPYLPGGIQGQLGLHASLILICSTTLYLQSLERQGWHSKLLIGLAGFLIGYAIGIRPNLIIPTMLVGSFVLYCNRAYVRLSCLLVIGIFLGIAVPFLPYFQSLEKLALAWSGSVGILQEWNKSFYEEITLAQFAQQLSVLWSPKLFSIPFWLFILLTTSCCMLKIKDSFRNNLKIIVGVCLWELGLIISYSISHIHHHYILLEWFGIITGLALMQSGRPSKPICLIFCIAVISLSVIPMRPLSAQDHEMISVIKDFNNLVQAISKDQQISAPSLPGLHWQNNKPIRTKGIHPVWSLDVMHKDLKSMDAKRLGLNSTWQQQCEIWLRRDVMYFFADDYLSRQCGVDESKDWQLQEQRIDSNIYKQEIKVYARKDI